MKIPWHPWLADWDFHFTVPVETILCCMTMTWRGKFSPTFMELFVLVFLFFFCFYSPYVLSVSYGQISRAKEYVFFFIFSWSSFLFYLFGALNFLCSGMRTGFLISFTFVSQLTVWISWHVILLCLVSNLCLCLTYLTYKHPVGQQLVWILSFSCLTCVCRMTHVLVNVIWMLKVSVQFLW